MIPNSPPAVTRTGGGQVCPLCGVTVTAQEAKLAHIGADMAQDGVGRSGMVVSTLQTGVVAPSGSFAVRDLKCQRCGGRERHEKWNPPWRARGPTGPAGRRGCGV